MAVATGSRAADRGARRTVAAVAPAPGPRRAPDRRRRSGGLALDALYRDLGRRSLQDVLDAQVIALLSTAELEPDGRLVPRNLAEPRLATPGSGLYAEILGSSGSWRSPSAVGSGLNLAAEPRPGERIFDSRNACGRHAACSVFRSASAGSSEADTPRDFVIRAAASLEPWYRELLRVRAGLVTGSIVLSLLLLGGLAMALRVSLRPLRRLEQEIVEIEAGRSEALGTGWPRELAGVTGNLNAFLVGERKRTRTLPHHARESRPQPEDPARRLAEPGRRRRDRS